MNDAHRIVSSEAEQLILVDPDDNETGFLSKADCHDGDGILHRAFSLFLFNEDGELLLQQRSAGKRLWPEYWSNSICSHPRRGESMQVATRRRLLDELNIETDLEFVYKFIYQADFGEAGAEHELCHVFLGRAPDNIQPNDHEIAAIRFLDPVGIDSELRTKRGEFTPWFQLEWQALKTEHRTQLVRFARF